MNSYQLVPRADGCAAQDTQTSTGHILSDERGLHVHTFVGYGEWTVVGREWVVRNDVARVLEGGWIGGKQAASSGGRPPSKETVILG